MLIPALGALLAASLYKAWRNDVSRLGAGLTERSEAESLVVRAGQLVLDRGGAWRPVVEEGAEVLAAGPVVCVGQPDVPGLPKKLAARLWSKQSPMVPSDLRCPVVPPSSGLDQQTVPMACPSARS